MHALHPVGMRGGLLHCRQYTASAYRCSARGFTWLLQPTFPTCFHPTHPHPPTQMMPEWQKDHAAGRAILDWAGLKAFECPLHLEGGSIHSDGQG